MLTPILSPGKKRKIDTNENVKDCLKDQLDLEMHQDVFVAMNELTWDIIQSMPKDDIMICIQAYMTKNNINLNPNYFDVTPIDDLRETFTIYTIELHTETSFSVITATTTDANIEEMDPIWAYFEYSDAYFTENDEVAYVLFVDIDEIRQELRSVRGKLCMQNTPPDEIHDDDESIEDPVPEADVHMLYLGMEENELINQNYRQLNTMFLNTLQFHKDNLSSDEIIDRDLLTIIGILEEDEIQMISDAAVHMLLRSTYIFAGDIFPIEYFARQDISSLRSELVEKNKYFNEFCTVTGKVIPLGLQGMSKRDVEFVSKECGQIILYRTYKDTYNSFRNTFGQDHKKVTAELKRLVRETIKTQVKASTKSTKKKTKKQKLAPSPNPPSSSHSQLSENTHSSATTSTSDPDQPSPNPSPPEQNDPLTSTQPIPSSLQTNTNTSTSSPDSLNKSNSKNSLPKSAPPKSNLKVTKETSVHVSAKTTDNEIESMQN